MSIKSDAARTLSLSRKRKKLDCARCGTTFAARDPRALYCSNACKCAVRNAKKRAKLAAAREASMAFA